MAAFVYVDSVNTNLVCCICRAPFVDPVTTKACAHTFCLECIRTAISVTPQCPVDRSSLTLHDLRPANPLLRNMVDELMVECPNALQGCTETCQRQLIGVHLRNSCGYATVKCSESGCTRYVRRMDLGKHKDVCLQDRLIVCPHCNLERTRDNFELHKRSCGREEVLCTLCQTVTIRSEVLAHNVVCPLADISCVHGSVGCTWKGTRHELEHHVRICSYEAIKGFLALHATQVHALEKENIALKRKIEELEGNIRVVADESETTRHSLGPWFRADASTSTTTQTHTQSSLVLESTHSNISLPRERRISPLNAAMSSISSDAPFVPRHDAPLDVSFAPPFSPTTVGDDLSAVYGTRAQPLVPPVNLNTSLEDSLNSLRNSIITLSAGLDAMGRRHDVALMTETLRMHEDVQSLRAIVHGLRMQVHQIMMERSQPSMSGMYSAHSRGSTETSWTTRAEYLNDAPSAPPISVPIITTIRRTTENKL